MDEQQRQQRFELMDGICYNVREGNELRALHDVRERNAIGVSGTLGNEITEWKYDLIWQMAQLTQSLLDVGIPEESLNDVQEEFFRRIYQAGDVKECRVVAEEMAVRFCRMNSLKKIQNYSVLVQKVLQEVDRDLSQTLTLQHLARTLNVNSSYLSSLFSREMGMTLTEYVTGRRISYAADLLRKTQYPIKTVAKKTGISDVQYFSRIFKKKMGVTPSRYRRCGTPPEC